ncbi:hypothetical protein M9Y10_009662 [Tritrichomonas musculus]|uniref:Uncharacterized protein n=1 Tax=Tritrichomonas musculus TaxID=1915356 RepID=A0ABR2IP51_9EUKA
MKQTPFLADDGADAHIPQKVIPQRPVSAQPLKIICDCSRGRGNFDEGNENDYDNLPKTNEKKTNNNREHQNRGRYQLTKSKSMDIRKNQFRYTPSEDQSSQDPPLQPSNLPPTPPSTNPTSPKKETSFQRNNKQSNQNNNHSVSFGGKYVDDHKSNSNRKRGSNQDRNGPNNNRSNDNPNFRGNRGRHGMPSSNSLTLSFGTKQQSQPSPTSQTPPNISSISTSQSNPSLTMSQPTSPAPQQKVVDWTQNKSFLNRSKK